MKMRHFVKTYAIATFILLCVFGLSSPAFAHEADDADSIIIHMTPEGFDLTDVEIEVDTTVIFENTDSRDRWPASNIHPTHGIFPNFDSKKPVPAGERWEFTFDKHGEWRFHDHLIPAYTGKITVVGEDGSTDSEGEGLFTRLWGSVKSFFVGLFARFSKPDTEEIKNYNIMQEAHKPGDIEKRLRDFGSEAVMQKLIADAGGGNLQDCHQEAHNTGRAAYRVFGAEVFSTKNAFSCHSGFYHGAMESFIAKEGTKDFTKKIETLCSDFETQFGIFECLHGVGHGAMAYVDYDMPEALDLCQSLSSDYNRSSCYGGVFMENIVTAQGLGATEDHETQWVSEDPHFPCNAIGEDFQKKFQCYQMQTSRMLSLNGYDFSQSGQWCLDADDDMKPVCFVSLGRDAAGHTLRDPQKTIDICLSAAPARYMTSCISGAVNVVIDFWGPDLGSQASDFCSQIADGDIKNFCTELVKVRSKEVVQPAITN